MYFFVSNFENNFVQKEASEHFWACRVKNDKTYKISDQNGTFATIKITNLDKKSTRIDFQILEKSYISFENWLKINQKNQKILFQAQIDKNYLDKWAEILPFGFWKEVFIFRSEFGPKQNVNLERLNRILTRSTEQSENIYKPKITIIDQKKLFEIIDQNNQNLSKKNHLQQENDQNNQNEFIVLDIANDLDSDKISDNFPTKNNFSNSSDSPIFGSDNSFELQNQIKAVYAKKPIFNSNFNSNFIIGPEGGFSDTEKALFSSLDCQFKTFGQIVYPSWLTTFLVK